MVKTKKNGGLSVPKVKLINNSYGFVVDVGTKGKRKQIKKQGFKNKKEAHKAMVEILASVNKGEYSEPSKELLENYIREWLLIKNNHLKNTTYRNYKSLIEKYIIPEIGHLKLAEIKERHIELLFVKFNEVIPKERKLKKITLYKKRLSNKSQSAIFKILKAVLTKAFDKKFIRENPIAKVKAPSSKAEKGIEYWSSKEAKDFLEISIASFRENNDSISLSYIIALTGGLRRGEVLGLKWKNVIFSQNEIRIENTLDNKKQLQSGTKTVDSRRAVLLPEEVMGILKERLRYVKKQKKLLGSQFQDNDLVICNDFGLPYHPDSVYKKLRKMALKAGIKPISFHALRHTHATILLEQNVHPKIVAERLGHSDVTITLNVYSQFLKTMQQIASDEIQGVFF
jgi:integrase